MKKTAILIFICAALGMAQTDTESNILTRKGGPALGPARMNKVDVQRVVPHLAVSEVWKSVLTIRNDQETQINLFMEFRDVNGNFVPCVFYDSDDVMYENATGYNLPLAPYEIYVMEFDQLGGSARSIQVFVISDELESGYGLEAVYNNFIGPDKVSSVGVGVRPPGDLFVMNIDRRVDAYTLNQKFRGAAITNSEDVPCQCEFTLYNQFGQSFDDLGSFPRVLININPLGKFVGIFTDIYPDLDTLLPLGLGYFEVLCSSPVSVLGLAFESNTSIVASVPVDYFILLKGKQGETVRVPRPQEPLPRK